LRASTEVAPTGGLDVTVAEMGGVTGVPEFLGRTSQFTWNGFNVIEQPKSWDVKYRGNAASHHFLQGETLSMACYSRFHGRKLVTCLTPKPIALDGKP
jgi:hypothetical protein